MKTITGIIAIILAVFSLLLSIVPGAMSILGFLISLVALVLAIFSVSMSNRIYYYATLGIVSVGMFVFNDGLRFWDPLPMPMSFKLTLYGIFFIAVLVSWNIVSSKSSAYLEQ